MSDVADVGRAGPIPAPLWRRIRERPERSPEFIALAAAERFGGPAEAWVEIAGPGHTPQSLAKVAYKKHIRLARLEGLVFGIGGFTTSALNLVGLGWIQARMVFYIAAAQGYDPRHQMRPAELLALWEVYETPAEARTSLDGAGKTMAESLITRQMNRRRGLMSFAINWMVKRGLLRLIPIIGSPISAWQNGRTTKRLGRAALSYYGGETKSRPDRY